MNPYDYFDYEGDVPSWYSVLDTLRELTREYKAANHAELTPDEEDWDVPAALPPREESPAAALPQEDAASDAVRLELTPQAIVDALQAFEAETVGEAATEAAPAPPAASVPVPEEIAVAKLRAPVKKAKKQKMTLFERLFIKRASRLKRFLISVLMLVFIVAIFSGVVYIVIRTVNRENKLIAGFNSNAAGVCSNLTRQYGHANSENLYATYNIEGYRLTGLCFVRELDFDEDGRSELMLTYNKNGVYINEVWGTNQLGSFNCLFSENAAQTENRADGAYSLLYRHHNQYYIAKFGEDISDIRLCQYKDGKFTEKYQATSDRETKSFSVDGKDATDEFEIIRYAVLDDLKASRMVDMTLDTIDGFSVGGAEEERPVVEQSINTAYYGVVQEYNKRYGVSRIAEVPGGRTCVDGLAVVKLVDFDGDEKDELLLVYRKTVKVRNEASDGDSTLLAEERYFCDIYRYSGNKAILTYSNEGLSNKADNQSDIYFIVKYEDGKAYYCSNAINEWDYGNHVYGVSTQMAFDGTEFKTNYKSSYETDYGYTHYYLEGAEVIKKTFEEKGCRNPFFGEDEIYDENVYHVTYVQRRWSNKQDIIDIPAKTEKEIQKLNQLYTADMVQNDSH